MTKKEKITYVDFKTISNKKVQKNSTENPVHTNPLDRLFKLVHTKLSKDKNNYKSYSEFKPEDLI